MRKVQRTVGSGTTKRERSFRQFTFDGPEDNEKLITALKTMLSVEPDPWSRMELAVEGARLQLEELEANPPDDETFTERVGIGWYLREIVMRGRLVRAHIDAGNASWAACEGFAVGDTCAEMHLKFEFDPLVEYARRAKEQRQTGAELTRKGPREQRVQMVQELIDPNNPKRQSLRSAFRIVGAKLKISAGAVKQDWYEAKKAVQT